MKLNINCLHLIIDKLNVNKMEFKSKRDESVDNYIKHLRSQKECIGFVDGYDQALRDIKALEMLEMLKATKSMIGSLKRSMLVHPDCELGSEFCDYTTNAQNLEDEIEQLIKEATTI